ncbi:MAG: hypothetical protein IJ549_01385 [Prevotella sp.]|nr:hypothetical protein [Prevotella sp.]
MKKLHLLQTMLLLVALLVGSSSAWADSQELNYAGYATTTTVMPASTNTDFGTIQFAQGTHTNTKPTYYTSGNAVRYYTGNTITLDAGSNTITQVVIHTTSGSIASSALSPTATSFSYSNNNATWNGSANKVVFTPAANGRLDKITVTYTTATKHTLSMAVYPVGVGTVTPSEDTKIAENGTQTITATATNNDYRFKYWTKNVESGSFTNSTSSSTTFTMGTEDATVTANFELIPTRTIAVTAPSGGTITVKNGDDVLESGSYVKEGTILTIIASAGTNKEFASWSVTGATPASTTDEETTFTVGENNVTIAAAFSDVITHAISWSVNGTIIKTDNVKEGNDITFAAPASGIPEGYVYKGWVTEANKVETPQASETGITYTTVATSTADITYYCVMAKESGTPASLTKMVAGDTFTSGDKIVVTAIDATHSLGMYQKTQGSSWVKNFSFTEDVDDVADDSKKWFTVTTATGGWYFGDINDGYLYSSSSTNLSVPSTTGNKTAFVFEDCEDGTFQLSYTNGSKRYICCRTDQTGDNKDMFRLSGSDGINKLTLYKYVAANISYSNYCTTATISKSVSSAGYATYVTPYAVEFAEGDAYVVTAASTSTTLSEVTSVPANTPVLLKGEGTKTATVLASASAPASNLLKVSDGTVVGDDTNIYVLANKTQGVGFYLWDSTAAAIPSGKVYLDLTGSGAKGVQFISFEETEEPSGEATAIAGIETLKNAGVIYNLAGQRVGKDYKGIVIVNGKKMLNK